MGFITTIDKLKTKKIKILIPAQLLLVAHRSFERKSWMLKEFI
jgi:hypothetical protein